MSVDNLFQSIRFGESERFTELLDEFDINVLNENKQSLLHEVVSSKQTKFLPLLLKHSINLNQKDKNGQTALHYCGLYNTGEIAEFIIKAGANVNICDDYGNQPLWTAVFNSLEQHDVVKVLMLHHANPNNKNNAGKSPLDFAKQINDKNLISLLEQL